MIQPTQFMQMAPMQGGGGLGNNPLLQKIMMAALQRPGAQPGAAPGAPAPPGPGAPMPISPQSVNPMSMGLLGKLMSGGGPGGFLSMLLGGGNKPMSPLPDLGGPGPVPNSQGGIY
jgi:hypothetical protein